MHENEGWSLGDAANQLRNLVFEVLGLDPGINEHLLCLNAVRRIFCQHLADEILYPWMHVCGEVELELVAASLLLALAVLREVAQCQPVQQYSKGPNIGLEGVVLFPVQQFWAHEAGRACDFDLRVLAHQGQSQVDQLNLPLLVNQYVLWLQVSVRDLHAVQVGQRLCDLPNGLTQDRIVEWFMFSCIGCE